MVIVSGRTAAEVRGSAFAVVAGVVEAASLAGLLVAGPLVDAFDPRLLVAAAGGAGTLAALACLALVRRETPAAPPPSIRCRRG